VRYFYLVGIGGVGYFGAVDVIYTYSANGSREVEHVCHRVWVEGECLLGSGFGYVGRVFGYHYLACYFRSAERVLLLLACGLVVVSCWFFAMGANKLQTASDYDLRYRYLRMQGKATTTDFVHLDSVFITNRNPNAILQMQQKVIDYEQALQQQAELIEQQERIKGEQVQLKKRLHQ